MNSMTEYKPSGFALQPQNLGEAMELAKMLSSSSMVPKNYIGKPDDTLVAMMMGAELRLNPIQSLQNIAVINGRPSIYGDALLALMQNHPAFGGITEDFDEDTMTASCTVWRKGGEKHTQKFGKNDAVTAGLWDDRKMVHSSTKNKDIRNPAPWHCYPKRMLQWRARGFAIRNQFADALAGLITREEALDMPYEEKDITPEPIKIEHYPADQFAANFPSWKHQIQSGAKPAEEIIGYLGKKGANLSQDQIDQINDVEG